MIGEGLRLGVEPVEVQGPLEDGLELRFGVDSCRLLKDQAVAAIPREAPRDDRFFKGQSLLQEVRPVDLGVFEGFLCPGIQGEGLVLRSFHKFALAHLNERQIKNRKAYMFEIKLDRALIIVVLEGQVKLASLHRNYNLAVYRNRYKI